MKESKIVSLHKYVNPDLDFLCHSRHAMLYNRFIWDNRWSGLSCFLHKCVMANDLGHSIFRQEAIHSYTLPS